LWWYIRRFLALIDARRMQNETRETETGRLSIYHPPLTNEDGGGYLIEFPMFRVHLDGEAPEEAIATVAMR